MVESAIPGAGLDSIAVEGRRRSFGRSSDPDHASRSLPVLDLRPLAYQVERIVKSAEGSTGRGVRWMEFPAQATLVEQLVYCIYSTMRFAVVDDMNRALELRKIAGNVAAHASGAPNPDELMDMAPYEWPEEQRNAHYALVAETMLRQPWLGQLLWWPASILFESRGAPTSELNESWSGLVSPLENTFFIGGSSLIHSDIDEAILRLNTTMEGFAERLKQKTGPDSTEFSERFARPALVGVIESGTLLACTYQDAGNLHQAARSWKDVVALANAHSNLWTSDPDAYQEGPGRIWLGYARQLSEEPSTPWRHVCQIV